MTSTPTEPGQHGQDPREGGDDEQRGLWNLPTPPPIPDVLKDQTGREQQRPGSRPRRESETRAAMGAWVLGTQFAYGVGGGMLLGAGVDWLAGTRPWFMLGGAILGLVLGFVRMVKEAMRSTSDRGRAPRRGGGA